MNKIQSPVKAGKPRKGENTRLKNIKIHRDPLTSKYVCMGPGDPTNTREGYTCRERVKYKEMKRQKEEREKQRERERESRRERRERASWPSAGQG